MNSEKSSVCNSLYRADIFLGWEDSKMIWRKIKSRKIGCYYSIVDKRVECWGLGGSSYVAIPAETIRPE